MPLQIRRGTQLEQNDLATNNIPLASGEPLWCTDTGNLYVGDGETAGGVLVNVPPVINLSEYSGTIGQIVKDPLGSPDVKSPFITLNGSTASIDLDGWVSSNVTPITDNTFELGSQSLKFKKANLGEGGISIGSGSITYVTGTGVDLSAESTVAGSLIVSATTDFAPILAGNSYNIGITANDDTVMVDPATLKFSNGTLTINGNTMVSTDEIRLGSVDIPNKLVSFGTDKFIELTGIITDFGAKRGSTIDIRLSRGTLSAPEPSEPGDLITRIRGFGHNGTLWDQIGFIGLAVDPNGPVGTDNMAGAFVVSVEDGLPIDPELPRNTSHLLTFDSKGVLSAPIFKAGSYSVLPESPQEGWLVFDSVNKVFKGWNGTSWVILG